jgi:hypothetical protein
LPKDGGYFATSDPGILNPTGYEHVAPEYCMSPVAFGKNAQFRGISPGVAKAYYISNTTGCRVSISFTVY